MSRTDSHHRLPLATSLLEELARNNPGVEVDQPTLPAISFMARVHQAKTGRGRGHGSALHHDVQTGAVVFRAAVAHLKSQGLRTRQDLAARQEELARHALEILAQSHLSTNLFLNALRENGADGATLRLVSHQAKQRNLAPLRERPMGTPLADLAIKTSKAIEGDRGLR